MLQAIYIRTAMSYQAQMRRRKPACLRVQLIIPLVKVLLLDGIAADLQHTPIFSKSSRCCPSLAPCTIELSNALPSFHREQASAASHEHQLIQKILEASPAVCLWVSSVGAPVWYVLC